MRKIQGDGAILGIHRAAEPQIGREKPMNHHKYGVLILVFLLLFSMHGQALAGGKYQVGDKVHLKGTYTGYSDGGGGRYEGSDEAYFISIIKAEAVNPYALQPPGKDRFVGWADASAILHDYTDEIFEGFFAALRRDSAFQSLDGSAQLVMALTTYFKQFNDYAKYDVKQASIWEKMFSVPFPGNGVKFWFNGYEMRPEDLGNYLYAAAGSYWGFSGKMIHQAAGYGQQKSTAYFSRPDLYYGDNQDDYEWIEKGIGDFSTKVKWDLDLADLVKNPVLWDRLMGIMEALL